MSTASRIAVVGGIGKGGGRFVYQHRDADFSQDGGVAALNPGVRLDLRRLDFRRLDFRRRKLHADFRRLHVRGLADALADLDLVVDLGARIGSRDWWRGLATLGLLCGTALALRPAAPELAADVPAPLGEAQWQEARAIGVAPLGLGADTGRRMAATAAVEPLTDIPERPSVDVSATIGSGDGIARALERAGVSNAEAKTAATLIAGGVPLGDLKSGTRISMTLGRRPNRQVARPLDKLDFRARFDLALAIERVDGRLVLRRTPIAVDDTPLRIRGRVGASLYRSARAAGAPAKAVETYLRALGQRLSVGRDVRSDDRFDIIVAHRRAATGETEVGQLLLAGLDQGKRKLQLMRWTVGGREQWFEASGMGEKRGTMRMPVAGRMTSGFGLRRHPILGFSRLHKGQDFAAPMGAPILAANDGAVAFVGWHGGHGNYVKLNHGGGLQTAYAHMSRFAVKPGQRVAQGQVIGYVGSTGLSTGPHLHYEVYKNGVALNPRAMSFTTYSQLAGAGLKKFKAKLAGLLGVPGAAAAVREASVEAEVVEAETSTKTAKTGGAPGAAKVVEKKGAKAKTDKGARAKTPDKKAVDKKASAKSAQAKGADKVDSKKAAKAKVDTRSATKSVGDKGGKSEKAASGNAKTGKSAKASKGGGKKG